MENTRKTISCIIPSYNEEGRIADVIKVISNHQLLTEIIIVDDGSKDATRTVVQSFLGQFPKLKMIINTVNQGKSVSICNGIKAASGDYLLFLDADLVGLNVQNIADLITPVVEDVADVSISLRRNAPGLWQRIGIDYISGERVFKKSLIEGHVEEIMKLKPFGLEVFFNEAIINNKCRIKIVQWPNVDSPFKVKKYGWYIGIKGDARMMIDIFRTISPLQSLRQIRSMMKLRVK